jgi:hypothetical protein
MLSYNVIKYSSAYLDQWNELVSGSKNGTFLFYRDFMEYHNNRFEDYSLIIYSSTKVVAVFPANRVAGEVHSHQGLTYGSLIITDDPTIDAVDAIYTAIVHFLKADGITKLKIKSVPSIYHKRPAFENDFFLYNNNATLYRKDMNLAIDFSKELCISKSKLKHFRRVSALGLEVRQDNNFEMFWDSVLVPRLQERYNVKPVHALQEIKLLHSRFPNNILQNNVYYNNEIVAGITIFNFGNVIKSQYGATTKEGEKVRALDYLFITLINEFKTKASFFDMGTVSENEGKSYNKGLLNQKQELGCSIYSQDFYCLDINT